MKIITLKIAVLFLIMCFFSSCFFYGKTRVYDTVYGLDKDTSDTVNVMIIHGIGKKEVNYADQLISNICRELEIHDLSPNKKIRIPNNFKSDLTLKADSGNIYYLRGFSKKTNSTFRFFIIHWSPITMAFKNDLINFDKDRRRAKLFLRKTKQNIMDTNLSDVAVYMNPDYKDYIQKLVEQAFVLIFKKYPSDAGSTAFYEVNSLNVLSGSFGSRIVIDVFNKNLEWMRKPESQLNSSERITYNYLNRLSPGFKNQIEKFLVEQPISFYMLSNQLPLFNIFDSKAGSLLSSGLGSDTLKNEFTRLSYNIQKSSNYKNLKDKQGVDTILLNKSVIVFNDPNDFLGYRVRKEIFGKNVFRVSNVSMRNTRVLLPGVVKLSNPGKAHENAFKNNRLHKIIATGHKINYRKWYSSEQSY
jgi:hypothetical protein